MTPEPSGKAPSLRFGCVILAAGPSTRLGMPKQLLAVAGRPLIVHAIDAALASQAWPVVVVLGAHAEKIRPALVRLPVLVVENAAWAEGMASSLRSGIAALDQFSRTLCGALVALCDQPAFSTATIGALVEAQRSTGRTIAAAHYSGRYGAPALFLREHFPALLAITGDPGARDLLNAAPERVAGVNLPGLATDVDTMADYEALR
jgi:molybdenum cofactor cytidylyltransferase